MKVRELIEWLKTQDQEAVVEVVMHESGNNVYQQGGTASTSEFNPSITEYNVPKMYEYNTAFKHKDKKYPATLLLGELSG